MIDGMVHVLHDEDVEDEHKKDWCANETETTNTLHDEKTSFSQQLLAEMEEMKDSLATTEEEIKTLTDTIAENDKDVHEATEQRKKEHQEFVDAFSTLDSAKRLMDKAMIRLRKFYSPKTHQKKVEETKATALEKAGLSLIRKTPTAAVQRMIASFDDASLIQKYSVILPETPTTYEKMEDGGVVGLMQEMKTELVSDMTAAETEEKNAAKNYVRAMSDAAQARADDVKSLNHKKEVKATTEMKITDARELHQLTEKEIHNLDLYMVQMHTECDFLIRNFEVRHEGRIGEETGLEEAKTIVTGEDPPTHRTIEAGY
jgi:predicted  nucleic acid-binding Zn-ribbon protein